MVFGVCFEVGGQLVDAGSQQGHLDFWATGVTSGTGVVFDNFCFDRSGDHFISLKL
jgi:hypothetical protein